MKRPPSEWEKICANEAPDKGLKVKVKSLSHVRLLVTSWTVVHQAPPSMGFSRQEYWSGVPLFFAANDEEALYDQQKKKKKKEVNTKCWQRYRVIGTLLAGM